MQVPDDVARDDYLFAISRRLKPMEAWWDIDEFSKSAMIAVAERTMTSPMKMALLIDGLRYLGDSGIEGSFVECGVWRGGSVMLACMTMLEHGVLRDVHMFDTFCGMVPPSAEDVQMRDGRAASELLAQQPRDSHYWAVASRGDVESGIASTGYSENLLHWHEGDVAKTLPDWSPAAPIAMLRLDTDWYESTLLELELLYEHVAPGGVVIVDDYGAWAGARQAVHEFLEKRGLRPMMFRADEARAWLKV